MPDAPSPHIVIIPLPQIRPTLFTLTASDMQTLLALTQNHILSLNGWKQVEPWSGWENVEPLKERLQDRLQEATNLHTKLEQIGRSMATYKAATIEVRVPPQQAEKDTTL